MKLTDHLQEGGAENHPHMDHEQIQQDIRKSIKVQPPDDSVDRIESFRNSNVNLDEKEMHERAKQKQMALDLQGSEIEEEEQPKEKKEEAPKEEKKGCMSKVVSAGKNLLKFKKGIVLFQYEPADPESMEDETGGGQ